MVNRKPFQAEIRKNMKNKDQKQSKQNMKNKTNKPKKEYDNTFKIITLSIIALVAMYFSYGNNISVVSKILGISARVSPTPIDIPAFVPDTPTPTDTPIPQQQAALISCDVAADTPYGKPIWYQYATSQECANAQANAVYLWNQTHSRSQPIPIPQYQIPVPQIQVPQYQQQPVQLPQYNVPPMPTLQPPPPPVQLPQIYVPPVPIAPPPPRNCYTIIGSGQINCD